MRSVEFAVKEVYYQQIYSFELAIFSFRTITARVHFFSLCSGAPIKNTRISFLLLEFFFSVIELKKIQLQSAIHVFFKKHKFKKHEAQNAEILRNI